MILNDQKDTNQSVNQTNNQEIFIQKQTDKARFVHPMKQIGIAPHLLVDAAIEILRTQSVAHFYSIYKSLVCSRAENNWPQEVQESKIYTLINLIQIKVTVLGEFFYILCDGIKDLVQRLKSKLKIKSSLAEYIWIYRENNKKQYSRDRAERISRQFQLNIYRILSYRQNLQDRYLIKILEIMQDNKNKQSEQILKQKYFKQLISSSQFQTVRIYWMQVFQKLQVYQRIYSQQKPTKQMSSILDIQNERMMNLNCLGCTRFMYQNALIEPNDTKLVAAFPYIHRVREYQAEIKQKINQFMNCGGGVILFDCHPQLFKIRIQGARITEKQKQAFEQILMSYLPSFYPELKLNKNIFISFIPLVQNSKKQEFSFEQYKGEEAIIKQGQKFIQRQYLQGYYVCKIIVRPSKDRRVNIWIQNQRVYQKTHLNYNSKGQSFKNIRRHIKKNFVSSSIDQILNQSQRQWNFFYSYFDDHQCTNDPEKGLPISNLNKIVQSQYEQPRSRSQLQNQYNYMSIIIAKPKHFSDIKIKLKRYGDKIYMDNPFADFKSKKSKYSAVLYHNIKFQTILKQVCFNKQFIYQGKNLLTINVTPFLKLKKRNTDNILSIEYFQHIQDWLQKQFHNEKLKLWQFITEKNTREYYLQTDSKLSTLFLYNVLQNYGEEVIFKCPLGLDKMNAQEKIQRFRQLYPLNQSKQYIKKHLGDQLEDTFYKIQEHKKI